MKHDIVDFLNFLSLEQLEVFTTAQVTPYFEEMDTTAYEFLDDLARRGWLTKLKKGLFARNPQSALGETYMPNWHKVAAAMMHERDYYIAYYSALQIHELITQPSLKEYIISTTRVHPKVQDLQGVEFEIIHIKDSRFFGFKKTWINDHDKVNCSDLEKTIIDCLDQPQHAGGLEGIIKAIDKAKDKIKANVLIEYSLRYKVQAVLKRLGYVLDHLGLYQTEQNIIQELITEAYTKLDPSMDIKGKFHRKWRIEDNVDLKDIIQTIGT